jgi:hypothetical protein
MLSPFQDFYSNLTTTASNSSHKSADQHEETSKDYYNTHVEYEWSTNIDLDDIFISVKTTQNYHDSRLKMIIKTWFQLAKEQVTMIFSLKITADSQILYRFGSLPTMKMKITKS